jgi:integrase
LGVSASSFYLEKGGRREAEIAQKSYFEQKLRVPWNPAMPSMRPDTIKFLTLEETTRLFHRLGPHRHDKAIFLLAYRHGLRASEVGMLRIEDIDFKTLRIMIHRLKGSHSG